MKFGFQSLTLLSFLLVVLATSLNAQTPTSGGIIGVVTDTSDAVVPGAIVKVQDNSKGSVQTTTTNAEGLYLFSFLMPGAYILTCTHPGFEEASRNVGIPLGPPVTLNIPLKIAGAKTTIEVTEQAPLFKAENGDVSATLTRQQISQVPNPGNDRTYIVQTAPGMIMDTDGGSGNFSNLGMPGTSNLFTLNGMNDDDLGANTNVNGALNLSLGANEIEEATVVSNGYSSQFGGAAGANVNYITKSGSNEFHGNAIYFWNGRVFNANDWINKANGVERPPDNANQWAASFGGPIRRDHLFFFLNTEGVRALLPIPAQVVIPSPQFADATIANIDALFGPSSASDAFYKNIFNLYSGAPGSNRAINGNFSDPLGCGPSFTGPNGLGTTVPCAVHFSTTEGRPSSQSLISGRVDWNIRDSDRAFLRLQYDNGHQATYTDPINPLFNIDSNQPAWQGQFVETHAFGPSAANQFLFAGWWQGKIFKPADLPQTLAAFPTGLDWFATHTFSMLGGLDNFFPAGRNATHFQFSDDLAKSVGNHKLGFGADFLRADVTVFSGDANSIGQLIPVTLDAFYQGGVDPAFLGGTDPKPDFTLLNQTFPAQESLRFAFYRLGFYVQDEWHLRSNLALTLSMRVEHQSNPICRQRCFARLTGPFESVSHDPDQPYNKALLVNQEQGLERLNNLLWSPRMAFAWQPFGVTHHTVLRGGIGIFFDPLPAALVNLVSDNPPVVNSFGIRADNLTPDETTSLFKDAAASNTAFLNGFAAGDTLAQIQATVRGFSPPGITIPGRKTFSPQYQKWSLEIQQAFGADTSATLGYYGNHGIHELVLNPSANAFGFGSFPANVCLSPPVPPCADPRFGQVYELNSFAVSNYNGVVASFEHRFTRWAQGLIQVNYMYGHGLDEVSDGSFGDFTSNGVVFPQDPNNVRGSYGPSEYDVRHSFNANYLWQVPIRAALRGRGSEFLVDGWQISGTLFARTGFPYTVVDANQASALNANNFFGFIYAVPAAALASPGSCGRGAAIPASPKPCLPPEILPGGALNPNALFVQSGCEIGFNSGIAGAAPPAPCVGGDAVQIAQGRNRFRGPGYFNTDFAVMKNTKLPRWEKAQLGIGFQFFNFFNHPNFGLPHNDISDPEFGQISYLESPPTTILGSGLGGDASPRMIQLKVQLQF
jgi:Carboxypeptidase regulatory-like domain